VLRQNLADSRTCSDPQVKEALALKAQNARNSYVDMLNRQGRNVWAKVSGIHEVESISTHKESGRKRCFAKASVESNMGMLAQPLWMTPRPWANTMKASSTLTFT